MSINLGFMETEQIIRAIYLTLLHSLWQGAAIAGISGIIMEITKRSSAASRYNFLAGSVIFFLLCVAITFMKMLAVHQVEISQINTSVPTIEFSTSVASNNIVEGFFNVLSSYSNRIVLLWFLIICLKSIQLWLGFTEIENLRTKQISQPGPFWNDRLHILSKKLGINQVIKLAESGLTMIPLTVGYLKPVILVPAGMLAAIPADQVEAILLHELAHIKRKDYFINIFQSIVEVFFFFNPAILWLSSRIRAERENCCDDIAIENSSSKIGYVKALVAFETYRHELPQLSVGFAGNNNTILHRTKRIIYNQNNTLNSMEKFILTSGLVLSGLLSLAFTDDGREQISKTLKPVAVSISKTFPAVKQVFAAADTVPASSINEVSIIKKGVSTYNLTHDGKSYEIKIKEGKVTELYIDKIKIADDQIKDYASTIREVVDLANSVSHSAEAKKMEAEAHRDLSLKVQEITETARNASEMEREKAEIVRKEVESYRNNIDIQVNENTVSVPAPQAAPATELNVSTFTSPSIRVRPATFSTKSLRPLKSPNKISRTISVSNKITPLSPINAKSYTSKSAKLTPITAYNAVTLKTEPSKNGEYLRKMLADEGLIINAKEFVLTINEKELLLDGVKQSDEIHRSILSKFARSKDDKVNLTYKVN